MTRKSSEASLEVLDFYIRNTSRFGWPLGTFALGLLSLSDLPQSAPWLFWPIFLWIASNLVGMDILYSRIHHLTTKKKDKTWLFWNQGFRISTSLAGSSMIALVFALEGIRSWAGVFAVGVWVGGFQALSASSFVTPRLSRMLVFLFSLLPLVFFAWKGDSQTMFLMVLSGIYVVSLLPKIEVDYQNFRALNKHRNKATSEKKKLERFIDLLPGKVSWLDHNLVYCRVNQKNADFFGRTKEDFLGQPFGFSKIKEVEEHRALLQKFLDSNEQAQNFILPFMNLEKQVRRHQIWLERFESDHGHQANLIILGFDIENQLQAEEALLQQRGQDVHSSRLASLGEMASGIAHEVRNPLAIISGANVLIRNELKKGKEMRLERIIEKSTQIDKTIKRILLIMEGMRKLARGDQDSVEEWFSLTSLIEETISFCEEKLRTSKIDIKIVLAQDNLEILGNQAQLSQVLVNLISNARDIVAPLQDRRIRIRAHLNGQGDLLIHVSDSGHGVSEPQKLFTPFFTTKGAGQGTGLGLSISRKIAEGQGGHLTYQRIDGLTVFELLIPVGKIRVIQSSQQAA